TNKVMYSDDGLNWIARPSAGPGWEFFQYVTHGNGRFVAVGGNNSLMSSPDGHTWTQHTALENNMWRSVAYGDGRFIAVAENGTLRAMTSTDGATWTPMAVPQ